MRTRLCGRIASGIGLLLLAARLSAGEISVVTPYSQIVFDESSGTPKRWVLCDPSCDDEEQRCDVLLDDQDGYVSVTTAGGPGGVFKGTVREESDATIVTFVATNETYVWRVYRDTPRVQVELPPGASLQIASGESFIPSQLPGFGQIYSRVKAVQVSKHGQTVFDEMAAGTGRQQVTATPQNWTGLRSRYWSLLVQPAAAASASVGLVEKDRPVATLNSPASAPAVFDIFAGPIEWHALRLVSPVLNELLFAALWDVFRWLCFGMLILLDWIYRVVSNYGVAIILLSLTVKILMYPLTKLADRWQADVNRIQTLLKPELDQVRRDYRGEEAHQRTLEVYKRHSVSPMYTFKSAAGFLIQIPIFIAAFDMLAENIALSGISFLWVRNLAEPDALFALPFVVPFFGGTLNLLPFLMTALSALAALLQREDSLSAELQQQQSRRLYWMAAAFFVLFYTFPAGMVLYWTSSNLFHLLKVESGRLLPTRNRMA